MKVLFTTNVPSPYRVDFFNELGKLCDLTVTFEKSFSSERKNNWKEYKFDNFRGVVFDGISTSVDSAFSPKILKYVLDKSFDIIVCTNVYTKTMLMAIAIMKIKHIPFYIEGDGCSSKEISGNKIRFKRAVFSGCAGAFCTSNEHKQQYLTLGIPDDRIVQYPFTSFYKKDLQKAKAVRSKGKEYYISKLGINESKIVLSVGRFSYKSGYGKGYDAILRAAEVLDKTIGIYIVGDEPTEEFSEWKRNKKLENVHFVGYKTKDELAEYYAAADVFMLMTISDVWGLVINEAMSYGLPIITTDKCGAGFSLVEDDINGYIVPVGDDIALANHISTLFNDKDKIKSFGDNSLKKIEGYTLEKMAECHVHAFEEIMNEKNHY